MTFYFLEVFSFSRRACVWLSCVFPSFLETRLFTEKLLAVKGLSPHVLPNSMRIKYDVGHQDTEDGRCFLLNYNWNGELYNIAAKKPKFNSSAAIGIPYPNRHSE